MVAASFDEAPAVKLFADPSVPDGGKRGGGVYLGLRAEWATGLRGPAKHSSRVAVTLHFQGEMSPFVAAFASSLCAKPAEAASTGLPRAVPWLTQELGAAALISSFPKISRAGV